MIEGDVAAVPARRRRPGLANLRADRQRVTRSDDDIRSMRGRSLRRGIIPFMVDGSEVDQDLLVGYRGKVQQRFVGE